MNVQETRACRSCGSYALMAVLNLGNQAIIKFKNSPEEPDDFAPLILGMCEKCKLVQLSHTVERDRVFMDSYGYKSGINQTMKDALRDVVDCAQTFVKLEWNDVVYDIGSNDNTLLDCYPKFVRTVGFEPSNVTGWSDFSSTHFIINNYFSYEKARLLIGAQGKKPKIITACAMFYSVENPNQFIQDVKQCLADDGVFILQVNYLGHMVKNLNFSDVVHEHVCYYSYASILPILHRNGLRVRDIETNSVNGGSIRLIMEHVDVLDGGISPLTHGDEDYLGKTETWTEFQSRIRVAGEKSRAILLEKKRQGKKIWALGASTRGNTVLQYFQLDSSIIEAISDRNPAKVGKWIAGTNIPIKSESEMREARPDYVLILNTSFRDEFVARESTLLKGGTIFLILLPQIEEISLKNGIWSKEIGAPT